MSRLAALRTLFALRPRSHPVPMAEALEACTPGIDAETAERVRKFIDPKGPQLPAPFEIDAKEQDGVIVLWPKCPPQHCSCGYPVRPCAGTQTDCTAVMRRHA